MGQQSLPAALELPGCVVAAGPGATFAWEEFFLGKIRNPYTRTAYRLAAFKAAPGFDASSWLPGEIMAKFFAAA